MGFYLETVFLSRRKLDKSMVDRGNNNYCGWKRLGIGRKNAVFKGDRNNSGVLDVGENGGYKVIFKFVA